MNLIVFLLVLCLCISPSYFEIVNINFDNFTIYENYYNCKCLPFYNCDKRDYVYAPPSGDEEKKLVTCDSDYYCCKPNQTRSEVDEVTSRNVNVIFSNATSKLSCGEARTVFTIRLLNSDDESAQTIPGEMPWIVSIFIDKSQGTFKFKCTGSLISPNIVLTATHCIVSAKKESLKVLATAEEIFKNIGDSPNDERNVKQIVKHPDYYSGGLYNDISLLILDKKYVFSKTGLNTICLPKQDEVFVGKKCLVAGWGHINDNDPNKFLKKVDVPIVERNECQDLLRKTRLGSDFELEKSFICAGGEEGKDTCKGDGGSPLMCSGKDATIVQVGIVSWGVDCGRANVPALYTNVAKYRNWIDEQIKLNT